MAIFIVETDAAGLPTDPVTGWHGPLEWEVEVDWIAEELDADEDPIIVPEIDWPTCRHLRRVDWCHTGVRPPRALPRGMRITIVSSATASGTEPAGVIGEPLECWSSDPIGADRNVSDYDDNDGMLPRTTWELRTQRARHTTLQLPNLYTADDFILRADARYRASDGTHWRLFSTNPDWVGTYPPPSDSPWCLAIAQQDFAPPTTKARSVVFWDPYEPLCAPGHVWPPQIWESDVEDFPLAVAFPSRGTMVLEWEITGVSLIPGDALLMRVSRDNWEEARCRLIFRAVPPIGWLLRFEVNGSTGDWTYEDPVAGDVVRCEIDRNVVPNRVRWYVNDIEQVDTSSRSAIWTPCRNLYTSAIAAAGGGHSRSDALIDWRPPE